MTPITNVTHRNAISRRGFLLACGSVIALGYMPDRALAATIVVIDAPTDGTDATAIIREQIAAAPDGVPGDPTTIRFPTGSSAGSYRVDGQILISSRRHLVIEGPNAYEPALIWTDRTGKDMGIVNRYGHSIRSHWAIKGGSSGIVLRNIAVRGPNSGRFEGDAESVAGLVLEHGFLVGDRAQGVQIENCVAENVHGDGVYVGGCSSDVRISSTRLAFCGRQGIAITWADRVLIDRCQLSGVHNSGIDLEPNGTDWSVRNVEIRNSSIDCRHGAFTAAGHSDVSNVWIHHNVVHSSSRPMLRVVRGDGGRRRNWTLEDNVRAVPTNPDYMVSLTRVDDIVIRRNVAVATKRAKTIAAVHLKDCSGTIEIADNDFSWSPELLETKATGTSVDHCNNRWGPDGSRTEDVCEEGLASTAPRPSTTLPVTTETAASQGPPPTQPVAGPPSTVVPPESVTQPPSKLPTTQMTQPETTVQTLPTSTTLTTSRAATATSARTPIDVIDATASIPNDSSLFSPAGVVAPTAVGLTALLAVVVRRRQRLLPQAAQLQSATENDEQSGFQSATNTYQPATEFRNTTPNGTSPDSRVPRRSNLGRLEGPSARPSTGSAVGRSRVEQESIRFALEYHRMLRVGEQDADDGEQGCLD